MIRNILIMLIVSLLISVGFTGIASSLLQARGKVKITNFSPERHAVRPGSRVRVRAATTDEAGGALIYDWKMDGRTVKESASDTFIWKAPREEGRHRISVTVANSAGSRAEASTDIIVSKYAEARTVRKTGAATRD